jgi:RNA polymerase sigma-70 factor (ECF subfamily)
MKADRERIREEWVVLRCQLKDSNAFGELVNLMEDRLFYYVRSFIHSEMDAYDVLQQVWLAVFRNINRLRDVKKFRPWIYRIAHNKAVSHARKEMLLARLNKDFAEQVRWQNEEAEWEPGDAADVHKLLAKMNHVHREVLTLCFLEGMKYEEIAQVIGCSVGTVKSRIHYAKKAMRDLKEPQDNV